MRRRTGAPPQTSRRASQPQREHRSVVELQTQLTGRLTDVVANATSTPLAWGRRSSAMALGRYGCVARFARRQSEPIRRLRLVGNGLLGLALFAMALSAPGHCTNQEEHEPSRTQG